MQSAEEVLRTPLFTPRPGNTFVSVVIRYDNATTQPIQVSENPWQMASADGVRHSPGLGARDDWLRLSTVLAGSFVVGSLTFQVPAGALELYYTQGSAPFGFFVWQVR